MRRLSDVKRIGYGAMRLSGPHIMGPPADPGEARRVLQRAIELGVDHIDTSDYYGPHVVYDLIREALAPYPPELVLVTKVGARRTESGEWLPWFEPDDIVQAVHDNLSRLGVERLGGVNLRKMDGFEGSMAAQWTVLSELQSQGLVADLGLSNVSAAEVEELQQISPVACVQNAWPSRASTTCRSSRSAGSARWRSRPWTTWPASTEPPRCRWRWPGCSSAPRTSC